MENKKYREKELKSFILSEINKNGPITFSQFMEWCLYHSIYGYYQSKRIRIGKYGDFYTSPCVHPLFGSLIAKQLSQMAEHVGEDMFEIVELGCGSGLLAVDILDWSKKNRPEFYNKLKYYFIENNLKFLDEQKDRLLKHDSEGKVFFLSQRDLENGNFQIKGSFLSNELIDSFPVHRVVQNSDGLKEIYVNQKDGNLFEELGNISDQKIYNYIESLDINLCEGQIIEVNLKALQLMETISRCLKKGFVITIDYGYISKELLDLCKRSGTLICYYQHRVSEEIFKRLGSQDMTSHVNFSALIKRGEEVGLHFTGLVPQYRFLIALGLIQELESLQRSLSSIEAIELRLKLKHLIEPEIGMGEIFKVLIQHKEIENPILDGLRNFD